MWITGAPPARPPVRNLARQGGHVARPREAVRSLWKTALAQRKASSSVLIRLLKSASLCRCLDLPDRVNDCRMVLPAKAPADLGQRGVRERSCRGTSRPAGGSSQIWRCSGISGRAPQFCRSRPRTSGSTSMVTALSSWPRTFFSTSWASASVISCALQRCVGDQADE